MLIEVAWEEFVVVVDDCKYCLQWLVQILVLNFYSFVCVIILDHILDLCYIVVAVVIDSLVEFHSNFENSIARRVSRCRIDLFGHVGW